MNNSSIPLHDGQDGNGGVEQHLGAVQEDGVPYPAGGLPGESRGKHGEEPLHGEDVGQRGLVGVDALLVGGVLGGVALPVGDGRGEVAAGVSQGSAHTGR